MDINMHYAHTHIMHAQSCIHAHTPTQIVIMHIEMVSINNCRYTQCNNSDMFTACRL